MRRKGGLIGFIFFMVIVTIFASGAIAVYTIFMKPENKSQVPQLVGSTTVNAVAEAEKLGLIVQLEPVASTLPEGRVLAQSPQPNTELRKGQVIVLQVSQGGTLHTVPNVKGKTLAKAQEEIKSQGFALGDVVKITEPNIKAGTVIAQSPGAPASVVSGKKIDLLVQDGVVQAENVTIPDVNRMTEAEARNVLEAGGVKVQAVDRVYSPLLPEGLAIETRPAAGTSIKAGQGVILKLATQRRPAGYMDGGESTTAKRVTAKPANESATTTAKTPTSTSASNSSTSSRGVTVSVGGAGDVFIGDDYEASPTRPRASTATTPSTTSTTSTTPASSTRSTTTTASTPAASTPTTTPASSGGDKTARIRYVVPPIARPMELRIELTDPAGKRTVMNRQVRSGESINTTAKYSQECMISIYLGGEFVWQERQR